MKKIFSLLIPVALVALCSGCQKEDPKESGPAKISVSISSTLEGVKTAWDKGDAFTLFGADGSSVEAKTASGGSPAKFSVDKVPSGTLVGFYPSGAAQFNNGTLSFPIKDEQVYGQNNMVLVGTGDKDNMTFSVPVSVIQVKLTGSCIVKDIVVEADKDIAGQATVSTTGEPAAVAAGGKTIVLKDINLTLSGEQVFNIIAGTANLSKLTVTLNDADNNSKSVEMENVSLRAGQATVVPVEHVAPLNLSTAGTANCYVVSGAGDFKFETKKVDGTPLEGDAADYVWSTVENEYSTSPEGAVEIVGPKGTMNPEWIVKNIAYDKANGTISFSATGNIGNAVIALYKTVGEAREIVWSWHIWSTGRTLEQMTVTGWQSKHLVAMNTSEAWLDVNMGATEAEDINSVGTYGLMYQWGRKDPFPGFSKLGSKTTAFKEKTPFGEYTEPFIVNPSFGEGFIVDNVLVTKAEVAKYPLSYFAASNYWCTDKEDVSYGDGFQKWSYKNMYHFLQDMDETWNYTDGPREADSPKDNDDPCPAGYRVPTIEQILHGFGWWGDVAPSQVDGEAVSLADHWADSYTVEMGELNKSRVFTSYSDANKHMIYACSGYREASGVGNNIGKANYYPSATKNAANPITYWRMICGDNCRMDASTGSYAIARNIRCVKIDK